MPSAAPFPGKRTTARPSLNNKDCKNLFGISDPSELLSSIIQNETAIAPIPSPPGLTISATGSPRSTYNFTYNPPDANGAIHLAAITNTIGSGETYNFQYLPLSLQDPWTGSSNTTNSSMMVTFTATPMNTTYGFVYDTSGEITVMELPYGGYMRWTYGPNTYQWTSPAGNNITLNAVTGRYLAAANTAWMTYAGGSLATEWSYPITYTAPPANESAVAGSCLADTTAQSKRCWSFTNGASTGVVVATDIQRWGTVSGTATELQDDALTYSTDAAGNSYIFQDLTTTNPGATGQVYSQTQQLVDQYGNVTRSSTWDYSTATPSGAATRVYTTTYQNACSSPWTGSNASNCAYVNSFLLSLPLVSTVKQGSTTVTLATNTYDSYSTYPLTPVSGLFEFDTNYGDASLTVRGNLTQSLTPGATSNVGYDMMSERRHPLHFRPDTSFTLLELPWRGGGVKTRGAESPHPA